MTRFLTPAKIALLALIELYTDGEIPASSILPILSFITSHLLPPVFTSPLTLTEGPNHHRHHHDHPHHAPRNLILSIHHFDELLSPLPASGLPGRSLWYVFLNKLWDIDSADALHDFFHRRSHLLARTRQDLQRDAEMGIPPPSPNMILLSHTSPFGAFVRRAQFEFARLKFHDAIALWKNFVAFRQVTRSFWRRKNPEASHWSFDVVLHEGSDEWGDDVVETFAAVTYGSLVNQPENADGLVSTLDVEKLLEFQVEQMQRIGSRVPHAVQDQLRSILETNIMIPSLSHYVSFLESWKAGDYPTSFDSLYRFFDYTMANRERCFYQYALLNLAVLQADFGSHREAVATMQESVAVARENKDMGCLNFTLSWLYHFGKGHPKVIKEADKTNMLGVEREGLVFLRVKAKESGMWNLWSAALLTEAKAILMSGESIAKAFENILRSSAISVSRNLVNNMGAKMLLQSTLWGRLGVASLAWSYCDVFLRCYSKTAPFDDILKFTCRAAYLLTEKGLYDQAIAKLEGLDTNSLRPLRANQYWLIFRGILRLKRYINRNDLDGAHQILDQLLQFPGGDSDLAFEINRLHIEAMTREGDYHGALAKIETLAAQQKWDGEDIYYRVKLLIMKALLLDKCGRPQKGFTIAVRAAAMAWRACLLSSLWPAMGAVANILTSLEEFDASSQILTSIIPRAIECQDCALNAQLYSFQADAHMGIAGLAERESSRRSENLTLTLEFLDRAFTEYSAVEDIKGQCEMMAKKATIMRLVGDMVLADDYASAYLALKGEPIQPVI